MAVLCNAAPSIAETTSYEYDNLHRLTHVTYDSGSWIRYEYDAVGNRVQDVMSSTPGVGYLYSTTEPDGSGIITRQPEQEWYALGSTIVVTAVPTGVCQFDHWTGDVPTGHEHDNPLTITMSTYGYMRLVAHFDSPFGHTDEDCDRDDVPDGCEWADTNANGTLDDCDPLIGRSVLTLENECPYGENAPDQVFDVWDAGLPGTTLSYTVSDNVNWLSCTPQGDTSTGEHDPITVHYQTTALPVGQYNATITISDPGAGNNVQTIAVALEVTGRAAVCRDTQTLTAVCDYGENAVNKSFDVWNCGLPGTTLSYTITDNAGWLSCTPPSGTSTGEPDAITVQFDSDELPCGQHFGTITVSDPDAAYSPRTVLVVLTVECPPGSCEPWDMNYDGMVSLIGDAPPFVDCVYFGNCDCPGPGCTCAGDCNHSGYLSIIGDLTCFVDCVYFGSCPRGGSEPPPAGPPGTSTIGGAVYSDLSDPLGSGVPGVLITADGTGGTFTATTSGVHGLWQMDAVPYGEYSITANMTGRTFQHVVGGVPGDAPPISITTDELHVAENESIQFLESGVGSLVPDLNCDGLVNTEDIQPFVLVLLDADAYASAFPSCPRDAGDLNCDRLVDGLDIGSFVYCLTAGGCLPCP